MTTNQHEPALDSRIHLGQYGWGTIKFIGLLPDKENEYYGISLDGEKGTNDGNYKGHQFFKTQKDHGLFITKRKVLQTLKNMGDGTLIAQKYMEVFDEDSKYIDYLPETKSDDKNEMFYKQPEEKTKKLDGFFDHKVSTENSKHIVKPTHYFSPESNTTVQKSLAKPQSIVTFENKSVMPESPEHKIGFSKTVTEKRHTNEESKSGEMKSQITDENTNNALKKLKSRFTAQESIYKSEIEKLQNKLTKNSYKDNKLKLENIKLQQQIHYNNHKQQKIDENLLGIAKDLIFMRRNVENVFDNLHNLKDTISKNRNTTSYMKRDAKMVELFKNLTNSILSDNEVAVQKYYKDFKTVMDANGIHCQLD
ncbi:Cytoskeleton-associated protein [Pseudoloma neurophilia]|uniref:Cytoskeleton-associated protein n=1 Tax=Pseudoloma neurophilia TaxID=146866 RepID=A0A0R0LX66_9MICR|nr:Cytoskeleton-associated protein [Pseudoloma neurophilia]